MSELFGFNNWTMVYRDGNFERRYNGKILCTALFGGIADAIARFARAAMQER